MVYMQLKTEEFKFIENVHFSEKIRKEFIYE